MDIDNINNFFTFTADHEEPCCGECDYVCASQTICNHCGPEYGWCNYQRTVQREQMTELDETVINLLVEHYKEKRKEREYREQKENEKRKNRI